MNAGQAGFDARYLAHTPGGTFYFSPSDVALAIAQPRKHATTRNEVVLRSSSGRQQAAEANTPDIVRLKFVGANADPPITTGENLPGTVSYFQGNNPANWRSGLPTHAGITYGGLYPGIDLQYDGTQHQLKGTYIVAPGADPAQIRWRYEGTSAPAIDEQGNLRITLD